MPFPLNDSQWAQVRSWLQQHANPLDAILAPNDFLDVFPGTYPYSLSAAFPADHFAFVVFHKAMTREVDLSLALRVLWQFQPVFANDVFVVYARTAIPDLSPPHPTDLEALAEQYEANELYYQVPFSQQTCAAVVITYNNAQGLQRSLPQLVALGVPIVIVDDGSTAEQARLNQKLADQHQVTLLRVPQHRQRPNAINTGVSYWLADPAIAWISCFQDDVEVKPDALTVLAQVQHAHDRPLLTGFHAPEHSTLDAQTIGGQPVLLKHATTGVHLHAHRDYWAAVLPIPTPAADTRKPGQGTDEDWWITAWSPQSIVKQGGKVVCVPDLVRLPTAVETKRVQVSASAARPIATEDLTADLSLAGARVLVDGYNLQLTKGTGIKTYGLSLIQALNQMGATVDVLLSRGGYKTNQILDEVYFFDNQGGNQNLLVLLKGLLKTASPLYRARRKKTFKGYVVKRGQYSDDFLHYATSFNLPQCYDLANALYKKLGLTTDVAVSEPIDLWHATYPLPMRVRGAKKITTVHDMIPLRLPYATLDDKENFYFKVRDALKDSAVTITVSENSKQDLLTYFDVDPDRIVVTYQPIALEPLLASDDEVAFFLKRYGLDYQQYLLFVGAIEPKKNVGRLLDAYATLDTDLPLVIVGKKGWLWENELGKIDYLFDSKTSAKQVKLLEYVSTDSLRYLYRGAYCLVFPSLYEGFGLPPVEAMHFGCPVITSNTSCLPEICGEAALYVDPYDVRDIKQALEKLLGDATVRAELVNAGDRVVKTFSRENYLRRLHKAYRQALDS